MKPPSMFPPVIEELTPPPDVFAALESLSEWPRVALLESAMLRSGVGRYSFLTADPLRTFRTESARFGSDPAPAIREALSGWPISRVEGLPPFQGGAVGLLAYEGGGFWERLPVPVHDELELPALTCGLYDWTLAWDHEQHRAWIIAHGLPSVNDSLVDTPAARTARARRTTARVRAALTAPPAPGGVTPPTTAVHLSRPASLPWKATRERSATSAGKSTCAACNVSLTMCTRETSFRSTSRSD